MFHKTIGFVGCGRIARILVAGWNRGASVRSRIVVADPDEQAVRRAVALADRLEIKPGANREAAAQGIVFLAIHPPAFAPVCSEIKTALKSDAIVVSMAPKMTIARLCELLGGFDRLARIIPNAPSLVGAGFNPIAFASTLSADDRLKLTDLLRPLGELPEVAESKLEAYAILTAMGPTYLWPQFYELEALSQSFGLSPDEAAQGLRAMVTGALAAMHESGLTAVELQDLIPVKPLGDAEPTIREIYRHKLTAVMEKIRPQ